MSAGESIAKHEAQDKAADANEKAARSAARQNSAELTRRGVQETIAASAQANVIRRQTLASRSSIAASAAAGGLAGNTVDALDAEAVLAQDETIANIARSLAWNNEALNFQKVAEYNQMKSRIASVPRPSALATGLSIGGAVLNGFSQFSDLNTPPASAELPPVPGRELPPLPGRSNIRVEKPTLPGLPLMTPSN